MGRMIDGDSFEAGIKILFNESNPIIHTVINKLHDQPTVEAIPKADYETRLKADMVAMLTEIQLEIEEIKIDLPFGFEPVSKTSAFYDGVSESSKVIQQKINALKGEGENDREPAKQA